jgi:hypothetical protein
MANALITFAIGYFIIQFIKKNKKLLKSIPIVSMYVDNENEECSNDAYLVVFAFCLKDFVM